MFTSTAASHPFNRRIVLGAATALAALSFGAADASAATVGRIFGGDLNEAGNDKVLYAGNVASDHLTITKSGSSVVFEDPTATITPTDAWCAQFNVHKVTCYSQPGFISGMIQSVEARMDEGADEVAISADSGIAVSVDGEEGNDSLTTGDAGNLLFGGAGDDTLTGGDGADQIFGDAGEDEIDPGAGKDDVFGGADADTITAKDGEVDQINCGAATDTVTADLTDKKLSCEVGGDLQFAPPPAPQDPPAGDQPVPPAPPADGSAPATGDPAATPVSASVASGAVRQLKVGVKALKLTRSGRLRVHVSCPKTAVGACRVVLSGRGFAKRTVSVPAGASTTVTLKLTGARKRAAKQGREVAVVLAVGMSDAQVKGAPLKVKIARRAR